MLKSTYLIIFFSVVAFIGHCQTLDDTLIGVVDMQLIKINKNTGTINNFVSVSGIPAGANTYKLTWCEPNQCFYTLSQSFPPVIAKIDLSGNFTTLGALTIPSATLFMCEGLSFNRFDGELYASASLNGDPNSSPADYYSETMVRIDTNTLVTTVVGSFATTSQPIREADALTFDDNGVAYYYDGQPGQFNRFYMQDLAFANPPVLMSSGSYTPTRDLTVKGNDLFFSQNRILKKINIPTQTFSNVGTMFTATDFNGQFVNGLTWRVGCQFYDLFGNDTTICSGQSLTLSPSVSGSSYLWQDGSTNSNYDVSLGGTYWVEVTDAGCTFTDTITVSIDSAPVVSLPNDTTLCFGQSMVLNAPNTAGNYLWQDGSTGNTFTVNQSGTYWLSETNNCGTATDSIIVDYYPENSFDLGNDTLLCDGNLLTIDVSNVSGTYLWQDGSTGSSFTTNNPSTYWVEITNNGCTSSDTITVSTATSPIISLPNDTTLCFGQSIVLSAPNTAGNHLWQDGSTANTFTVNQSGTYWLNETNNCGTDIDTIIVSYYPEYSFDLGNDTTICIGNTVELTCSLSGATVVWQDGSTGPNFTVTNTGIYSAQASLNGCLSEDNIEVNVIDVPVVDLGSDLLICADDNFLLSVQNETGSFQWNTGSTESSIVVNSEGTYSVQVINICGATSDSIRVDVEECYCGFYVPNAFTPNSDEFNNLFGPVFDCIINSYNLRIYNRWGEVIFESEDPYSMWDGTYSGKPVQDGVYSYVIKYSSEYDIVETVVGHVTLIR